jgi:hypothetical protein
MFVNVEMIFKDKKCSLGNKNHYRESFMKIKIKYLKYPFDFNFVIGLRAFQNIS